MVVLDKTSADDTAQNKLINQISDLRQLSTDTDLVVIIPAYNEARFIGSVVVQSLLFTKQVIVVDDGSTDNTAQIARAAGASVVCHEQNQGKGAALNSGFREARRSDPQVVVCLDGDGQHLPDEIDRLVEPIISKEADIVIGSRYLMPGSQVPLHRVWGHRLFNLLTKYATGVYSSDSQSGFRAFSPRALQAITFCSHDFSVESEMQFLAKECDLRMIEVPITICYSDPPKRSVLIHGVRVLNGVLRLVGLRRPLFYFGTPGAVLLIFGILLGVRVVEIFSRTHLLAVGSALLSILLSMVGMILFSTGFTLHSMRALLTELFRQVSKQ